LVGAALAPRLVEIRFRWPWLLGLSMLVGLAIHTHRASSIWTSPQRLWAYNLQHAPNEWAVHLNAGGYAGGKGRFQEARQGLEEAWKLAPHRLVPLQSLFLARAVILEPQMGVQMHQAFLASIHRPDRLKKLLMSPYFHRHAPLVDLIRFRYKALQKKPSIAEVCKEERERRRRAHPHRPR
jgi:hypothetical protein